MIKGKEVPFKTLKNPVLVRVNNKIEGAIAMEDIPKVILSAPTTSRAMFADPLGRFICDTVGPLLCNMEQSSENFNANS